MKSAFPSFNMNHKAIVPTPKKLQYSEGNALKPNGQVPFIRLIFATTPPGLQEIAAIIGAELTEMFGSVVTDDEDTPIALTFRFSLDDSLPHSSPEAYRLIVGDEIRVHANAFPGFLYAIATLRQLISKSEAGKMELSPCEVYDYPDIEFRCSARWLVELEGSRMMFDWGDGRENMLERYRQKIDFCMRFKINMAFFEGFEWRTDKYPKYCEDMRLLNSYAAARNVRLEFGGYTVGFGGFPGHELEGIRGLGGEYNRRSYPNGEIYACGKVPDAPFDSTRASITSDFMLKGNCRSNEALNNLKAEDLEDYVRKLEPRVLYLHNEDIATYAELVEMWSNRCPECKRRWANDEISVQDGVAGAIADGFERLYQVIASVNNPNTGYDGGRDCLVIFVSPTYGTIYDDDDTWDKICDLWVAISEGLNHSSQIMLGMREQFFRGDRPTLRLKELHDRLNNEGHGHGLFVFSVGGANLHTNSALFTAHPRLNHFFEGGRCIFNFNGGIFAGPQEIYNAEYAWNLRSPYGIDTASNLEDAKTIHLNRAVKLEYLKDDQLLKRACDLYYGEAGSIMVRFYTQRDEDHNYPAAMCYLLFQRLFKKSYVEHDRVAVERQWSGIEKQTIQALELIDEAILVVGSHSNVHSELKYLRESLVFGGKAAGIVTKVFSSTPDWLELEGEVKRLRVFVVANRPRHFTSSSEGEMNLWTGYLDGLSAFIGKWTSGATQAV